MVGRIVHANSFQFFLYPIKVRVLYTLGESDHVNSHRQGYPLIAFDVWFNCREKRKKATEGK